MFRIDATHIESLWGHNPRLGAPPLHRSGPSSTLRTVLYHPASTRDLHPIMVLIVDPDGANNNNRWQPLKEERAITEGKCCHFFEKQGYMQKLQGRKFMIHVSCQEWPLLLERSPRLYQYLYMCCFKVCEYSACTYYFFRAIVIKL